MLFGHNEDPLSAPWTEELVERRTVERGPEGWVVTITPKHPLLPAVTNALLLEAVDAEATRIPGQLALLEFGLVQGSIRAVTAKLDEQSMNLHTFMRGLAGREPQLTLPFAEYVVHELAETLGRLGLHTPSGVFSPRHGLLRPSAVALGPDGRVTMIGGGHPLLTRLFTPPGRTSLEDRRLCAPEVLRGGPPTQASDVYSMGAILVELFTSVPYLQGMTPNRLAARAAEHAPPELSTAGLRLPGAQVLALLATALAPSPEDRFPDLSSLSSALTEAREDAKLPRWTNGVCASFQARAQVAPGPRGAALLLGLRAPTSPSRAEPPSKAAEHSVTRDNLFDNLEIEALARRPPPPPPPRSDPPPIEMKALSRQEPSILAEALHVTDEMVHAERSTLPRAKDGSLIYNAAMVLFGAALVLTLITLFLFVTS